MPICFQELIAELQSFWQQQGCAILQPIDIPVGAGTFHPKTFFKAIGPDPWRAVYVQPCRRPADGRYGDSPNRLQHYYQMQVVLKPAPHNIQALYIDSLKKIGIDPLVNDIRFVEDNWKSPTLGAWGLGWEVWQNGMEISQFTYFQQVGGLKCCPIMGEITYGLERLAMQLQQINNVYELVWFSGPSETITYGDLFLENEKECAHYNFEKADTKALLDSFHAYEAETKALIDDGLPLAAYECTLYMSHAFNLLDARGALSVTSRQQYLLLIMHLTRHIAQLYHETHYA